MDLEGLAAPLVADTPPQQRRSRVIPLHNSDSSDEEIRPEIQNRSNS